MTGGWTSPLFVQTFLGSATAEVDQGVFVGAGASGSFYAGQVAQNAPTSTATIHDSVFERAKSS